MHTAPFDYQKPTSIDQALNMLSADGARALAGGHSLLPAMKLRLASPETLVDLAGIAELTEFFTDRGGTPRIGAMVTHAQIAEGGLGVLSEAAALIGDRQVRNRGTIGGSIAHADPAADYPAVLVAVGAEIEVRGSGGTRTIGASDFFVDLFTTALQPGELVTRVSLPDGAALDSGVYEKHKHPASGYAVVGVCTTPDHMVVGGATGAPVKVAGNNPDDIPGAISNPIGDVYASGEYRVHLATILAKRALARLP